MALDLSRDRYGSKAKDNEKYVSGAEIMARAEASKPLKKFESDVRKFYSSVDKDTRGEGIFGAADFYEERKKQAEDLKKRAETISMYLNDHAENFTTDSYDNMMNMLSSFDTDMDDIMTRYQPSLDAKAGMRAYEDELRAAMERDKNTFSNKRLLHDREVNYKMPDYSARTISETWTPEQRYRLGMMQMDDPSGAREYAGQVNAGRDPYVLRARAESMDLEAEMREIERLQAELEAHQQQEFDFTSSFARKNHEQETQRLEREISDRTQFYNQAKQIQEGIQFASATQRDDFAAKSGYTGSGFEVPAFVEDADPDELTYEYINDPNIRTQINRQTNSLAAKGYDLLNEEEVGIYNYYYATEGPVKAQQYLDNIQETLNKRMGDRAAESKKDSRWRQYFSGFNAGYSNAVTAPQYLFNNEDEYIPTSALQFESAAIREDLADTGAKLPEFLGGASMGQVGYDLANTVGNMAPSMLISAGIGAIAPALIPAAEAVNPLLGSAMGYVAPRLGQVAGAATMGLSSAGGAYQQALNAGYSKEQARNYALLSGASEAGMEYLLGGISKLGGEIPQQVIKNMVSGVDKAIARAAITLGGSVVSEGFEEGLQEVITPWLENLVLYADKDVNWDEVAYSTLLGALSGGVMEGPRVAVNTSRVSRIEGQLKNLGEKGNAWDLAELIVKHRSGEQLSEEEFKKLVKSEPAMKILEGMRSAEPAEPAIANMTAEQMEEMKPTTSADGNARQISSNETINVMEFAEVKDGKAKVRTDDGTVDYQDVSFATEKEGNQYFAVESLQLLDTEHANKLLQTIQKADVGKDTAEVLAIREAYRLGYMGAKTRDLRGSDAQILSTNLQDQIYDIGRQQRSANDAVRVTAQTARTTASKGYKKVIIEGKLSNLTGDAAKKRKAEIAYVDRVADTFAGTAVHVYESYEKNGKRYYKDNSGKEQLAPNGKYVNDEIWVDLNSGDKGEGMMLNTFAHEMYHHIEKWNKPKARELAEFVVKELGLESVDKAVDEQIKKARAAGYGEKYFQDKQRMTAEQAQNEVYMRAMSDFVADSLETMFTRGNPAEAIANLKKENKGLFDQIKAFIDEWITKVKQFYSDKTISEEGAMVAQLEKFEQLQQLFMEAMAGAGENYNAALESITPGEAGIMVNEDGDPVAMSTEDGSVMLSIRTYEEDGREAFRKYLDKCVTSNRLTEAEAKEMRDGIEEIYNVCKEFKDKYAPFSTWSDAEVIRDTRGRPVFSVVTPNGDYKMNLDFSLVCKKRRTLDAVFNEMSRRGIIDDFELGQKSVVKINEIIRKHGLETACALCFVDAKRFRQASMADSFTRLYNELVESLVPEDQKGSIDHFNFSGYETIKKVEGGIDTWDNSKLDFSHLDDVMKRYGKGTVEHKAAKYIKSRPEARKLLLRGDFMSSQGFDAVKSQNKDILKLYNSKKGTGGPKAAFGDVQYLNEIIKKERTWTPSKAYEVGGIRIQSFSDYVPRMVFDYTQMIYDLAARKLPAHAYTKESLFVKQFGLTGVKINMSLIPAVAEGGIAAGLDAKGNYVWAGESFNYDEAVEIQNAEGYTENCGTICVGVSKQHIEKLLRDPNIRMVIPYHKSGLNPIVAHMNKIAEFTDYTNDQRTKGKDGKAVSKDFNFNEAVKRTGDPKAAANEYLKWCADNGYTPKFDEFKKEDNYYKLLEDFTLYDKDGKYVPQREVRAVFPKEGNAFGTMKNLIKAGLKEDAIVEGKRDKKLSSIVDEIQKTLPKTEAEISEEQVKQADRDLEANYSLRNSQTDTEQFRIWFNGSKVVNADGSPKVMYHGTSSYGFRSFNTYGGKFGLFGKGSYFTDNPEVADSYTNKGKGDSPGVYDVYLNIKNPLDMDANADISVWKKAFNLADMDSSYLNDIKTNEDAFRALKTNLMDDGYVRWEAEEIVTDIIEGMGYDGITHIGGGRYGTKDGPRHRVYIAFNPEQIKSASKNIGTFDGQNTDIYYSIRNQKATAREILMQTDPQTQKNNVKGHLVRYQERVVQLNEAESRREEVKAQIETLSADPKKNRKELAQLRTENRNLTTQINGLKEKLKFSENTDMMRKIVANERLKNQPPAKSYKDEQEDFIRSMLAEHRVIRKELTGADSVMFVMEDTFVKLAKDYEAKKIDMKTMEKEFMRIMKEYEKQTEKSGKKAKADSEKIETLTAENKIWLREYKRLMKEYDLSDRKIARLEATIARQRADAKAKITQVRETQEVQKQRKQVEDNAKKLMRILANPTKDAHAPMALQEPLQKFLDSIDFTSNRYASGGSATIKDRSYINALAKVRDAIKGQRTALTTEDGVFTLDVPPEFTEEIDKHINMVSDATEGLDLTTNRIYEMTSAELKDLNYILKTINKAIRDIDRMHMQGEKARTSGLARDTMQEMQNRKPIKGEKGNWFMWNNYTPFHAFRRYGKAAMKIFDGLKAGQAKLARTIDSVVKFTEKTYTAKEVKDWEHNRHEIKLDSGKTVTMSSAQIMTFWCLSHRDQAIPHMQGAGIRMTTLEKFVGKANTQKELVQKDHFSLTLEDVNRINQLLTDRQRTVAREMQQFMQNVGGKLVNEISMARWDFMAATEKDYFPIDTVETSRDVKNPDQKKTSLFALLNKSFTKAPVQNARNAMVIDSIFNVFANHMSEVAEYNAFALPLVDTMKWFNYRENVDVGEGHIHDVGVNRAIRDTLGTEAIQYFVDLMTDINSSQKAGRHEDFFGKILGRSKAASVAWNTRVAIQQISALPRASMILNYKSLIKGASKIRLKYATQEMMKYSGIALWKSMGYYDLNVGKSVERQIKGDTSIVDKFNEVGMWLPGKMDERTWARIWIATKDQVQNTTHLTGEDLLQATAKKFEEVVYETQVVDSVLTKSSFMRDKNLFIKEATSFMAEPTLAINILMSAFQDYEEGHSRSEKVKRGLMIGFTGYALAGVVNALLSSFSDAWRDDDEFEDFWEKYRQALFGEKFIDGNLFSELNPIEKIAFVKDILSVAKGNEPHSTYSKLMTDALNLINSYQSIADGKGSKTAYGVVYQTLQYLSTASGVGMSNMTREVIDIWNNTIGKFNPEQRILRYKPDNGEELLNAIQKGTEEDIQRVFGRFENQQKAESALQSAIRAKYVAGEMTAEEAEDLLTTNFDRDDEHEVYWILEEWDYAKENGNTEGYTKYGTFFEAIDSGEDYTAEMDRLMAHGAEASDIRSQISKKYRKQYLEDETVREDIREKLRPVYEATGMYADDIEDKFNDWDFEAEYGMTYGAFKSEYRDGMVTENEMREAMEFYGLMQYEIAEDIRNLNDEIKFVNQYDMTLSEMKDAYDHGDVTRNQMTNALVFSGMTQTEAREWVKERDIENRLGIDYAKLDDAYKHNDISRATLYNAMIEHGATKQEADDAILGYDWLKKHVNRYPDLAISDAKKFAVRISTNAPDYTLEDFGVKVNDYIQYSKLRPDCKGVDRNGDGQADSGTKRDAIFSMIDSLPISSEAKDGLALIDYGMKSIKKNAPWH